MIWTILCFAGGWFAHKYKDKWMPDAKYIIEKIKKKF